jgi:hypothetical protein
MTRINFDEVKLYSKKSCKCKVCGKRLTRQKTFWQTLSPFNRNADGVPRTRKEIMDILKVEIGVWRADVEICSKCERVSDSKEVK